MNQKMLIMNLKEPSFGSSSTNQNNPVRALRRNAHTIKADA